MRISVICPVLNEVDFIGYSIMAVLPYVHEFVYALDEKSSDGTRELLQYVKDHHAFERLRVLDHPTFHPHDMKAYNAAFNRCIAEAEGEAIFFLHPDMIVTRGGEGLPDAMAWYTTVTSYAGDMQTVITKGRCARWKNIHAKKLGLHYFGGYGSQNEDLYHAEITGSSHKHYGDEFSRYPFSVKDSGIKINHYCELKSYKRRLEKMKLCLKTLIPNADESGIDGLAAQHPRVTLEPSSTNFGQFQFEQTDNPAPEVFEKYKEIEQFKKELVHHA